MIVSFIGVSNFQLEIFSNLVTASWRLEWVLYDAKPLIFNHYRFSLISVFIFLLFSFLLLDFFLNHSLYQSFPFSFYCLQYVSRSERHPSSSFRPQQFVHQKPMPVVHGCVWNDWVALWVSCPLIVLENYSGIMMPNEVVCLLNRADSWNLCCHIWKAKSHRGIQVRFWKYRFWRFTWPSNRASTSSFVDASFNRYHMRFRCKCCKHVLYFIQNEETVSHVHYRQILQSYPSRGSKKTCFLTF